MLLQEEILLANGGQLPAIGSVLGKFVLHLLKIICLDVVWITMKYDPKHNVILYYTQNPCNHFHVPPPSTPIRAMHS